MSNRKFCHIALNEKKFSPMHGVTRSTHITGVRVSISAHDTR